MTGSLPPPRELDAPPSARFDGEDFLFHLYRGSELLQDNCVEQAKEELERALRMQPRDVEGQGLLGVVYFRLGMYPRAIEIYREIVRDCPDEVTPKLNLALCYFKTGQPGEARDLLEEVLRKVSDHPRAWGYLGLVFERLGEFSRAAAAFERAGQPHLARRMQKLLDELSGIPGEQDAAREEIRRAAAEAVEELETSAQEPPFSRAESEPGNATMLGRWQAVEPGEQAVPPLERRAAPVLVGRFGPAVPSVPDPAEIGAGASVPPRTSVVSVNPPVSPESLVAARRVPELPEGRGRTPDGLVFVTVQNSFALRGDRLRACSPASGGGLKPTPLKRRTRGRESDEPFSSGGAHWALLEGDGLVLLEPGRDRELTLLELAGQFLYVRETRLVGFDGALRYENGRLPAADPGPIPMVQFAGRGALVFEAHASLRAITVAGDRPLIVRAASVLGWTGRLLGQAVPAAESPTLGPGFVEFNGEGSVLVDDP